MNETTNNNQEQIDNWGNDARATHNGQWIPIVDQKYKFWTMNAESLMVENKKAKRDGKPTYSGNLLCFMKEARILSRHVRNSDVYSIDDRIMELAKIIDAVQSILPTPKLDKKYYRKGCRDAELKIAGDNKLALRYICRVLIPYDLVSLSLWQHKKKCNNLLPINVGNHVIRDWQKDFVDYIRRRSRGIFQDTRKIQQKSLSTKNASENKNSSNNDESSVNTQTSVSDLTDIIGNKDTKGGGTN